MHRAATWAAAIGGSLALHAGAIAVLLPALAPEPVPDQPTARSSMALETFEAPTTEARAAAPEADTAPEAEASSAAVNAAAVPQSRAEAVAAPVETAAAVSAAGTRLSSSATVAETAAASAPPVEAVTEAIPRAATAEAVTAEAEALRPATANAPRLAADAPEADTARPVAAPVATLAAMTDAGEALTAAAMPADAAAPVAAESARLETLAAPTEQLAAAPGAVETVAQATLPSDQLAPAVAAAAALPETAAAALAAIAPGSPLPETRAKAALAWRFGDRLVTDPQALATIQAFMAPQELEGSDEVRDDLASVLTGVECARVSATFLPESGTLELRGHVPDPSLQQPLLDALRQQVGEGIPIRANLLHLPAPQCGALAGMEGTTLPQSTDQFTNPLLIGATAQARDFSYTEGQRLTFDMTAPDYDAFVYVDYFAADGSVIHLVPNETIPLTRHDAKTTVSVGQDLPNRPGLRIIIGPPFGQEIAVAFAASQPLYDGLRPISEPAAPYLAFLAERVAAAREADPGFKGEWVYFFITTSPASQ